MLLALAPAKAAAQERAVIAVVRAAGDEELIARVRGELEAMGFELIEGRSEELEAVAQIEVRDGGREVEVWTRKGGARDVIALREEDEGVEELVLGVVEALRARLKEASAPTTTTTNNASAATPTNTTTNETASTSTSTTTGETAVLWAEAAPALIMSGGGLGAEIAAFVGLRWQASSFGSIAGFGVVPLWRQELRADEGRADVSTWMLGLALDGRVSAAPFELAAGVGIASVIVVMSGEATGALDGYDETDVVAAPIVRGSAHWDLGALRLVLRAHAGLSIPRIAVVFDEREAAHWGQPFVAISLGAELPLMKR